MANRLEIHTHYWWGRLKERPLRRHKPRKEGLIKMELRKVDWINLFQYRDYMTGCFEHGNTVCIVQCIGNFLTCKESVCF